MAKKILIFGILLLIAVVCVSSELKKGVPVSVSTYRIFESGTEKEVLEYYYFNETCTYYPGNGTYVRCKHIINSTVTTMAYDNNLKRLKYGVVESITTYETAK